MIKIEEFNSLFKIKVASTKSEISKCKSVRHTVYAVQQGFTTPNKELEESDDLDQDAIHILLTLSNGSPVGTGRILYKDMPIYDLVDNRKLPKMELCCEVSRFCINHQYIREKLLKLYGNNSKAGLKIKNIVAFASTILLREHMRIAIAQRKPYLLGVTESRLVRKMNNHGFYMENIGEPIEYHGIRQPFLFRVEKSFDDMACRGKDHWNLMTENGVLSQKAHKLASDMHLY